jgi:hypothetical protein
MLLGEPLDGAGKHVSGMRGCDPARSGVPTALHRARLRGGVEIRDVGGLESRLRMRPCGTLAAESDRCDVAIHTDPRPTRASAIVRSRLSYDTGHAELVAPESG